MSITAFLPASPSVASSAASAPSHFSKVIERHKTAIIALPSEALQTYMLEVTLDKGKPQTTWTKQDHKNTYALLQKIARFWASGKKPLATSYMIYSEIYPHKNAPFTWSAIPYPGKKSKITQLTILFRLVFGMGKIKFYGSSYDALYTNYKKLFQNFSDQDFDQPLKNAPSQTPPLYDPFAKSKTLNRQKIYSGNQVHLLFNYAPIGLSRDPLHFLLIPKDPNPKFTDLPEKTYLEMMEIIGKVIAYFTKNREIYSVHIFHKTGKAAGQSVDGRFHIHLLFLQTKATKFWGAAHIIKNIAWGSTPLSDEALAGRVAKLTKELNPSFQNPK